MPQLVRPDEKPVPPLACWGTYHGVCIRGDAVTEKKTERVSASGLGMMALPDGTVAIYATRPDVVLYDPLGGSRHTGVCDFAWTEAQGHLGDGFTPAQVRQGWPLELTPGQLANLQFALEGIDPHDVAALNKNSKLQVWCCDALQGLCESNRLAHTPIERVIRGGGMPPMRWSDYLISAATFRDWLETQGIQPSRFIAAWCKANRVAVRAPEAVTPTTPDALPESGTPSASEAHEAAPADIRKRAALIETLRAEWPTIEADLREASRNGLSAARVPEPAGFWNADKAREWARQRGKLRNEAPAAPGPWAGLTTVRRMKG